MIKHPYTTFHHAADHPNTLRFSIQTHEDGAKIEYEVLPGAEVEVPNEWAYAVPSLAPQLKEGPAPKAGAPQAKK